MALTAVLGFWAVAALLIIVPGPDWAFAVSAGLRGHGVAAAIGIVLGYLLLTAAVAAGVGAVVATSPSALSVLTVAGGGYLLLLGVTSIAHPAAPGIDAAAGPAGRTAPATVLRGVGVSGLNPKGLLVFVAVLPQFTTPGIGWPLPVQLGLLGVLFSLTCAVVYLLVGGSARRVLRARPGAARLVGRVSGCAMLAVGAGLLIEHLPA